MLPPETFTPYAKENDRERREKEAREGKNEYIEHLKREFKGPVMSYPFLCILWLEFSHGDVLATREAGKGSVPECPGRNRNRVW